MAALSERQTSAALLKGRRLLVRRFANAARAFAMVMTTQHGSYYALQACLIYRGSDWEHEVNRLENHETFSDWEDQSLANLSMFETFFFV